ncbi:predicted protein [Nematostella vectensis]|uniref:Uncharacterized protein n=2 Tax=Nematostella vectensis TaxID=45351 RepID=A7SBX9_NEMVE|nr:predicted protein [Nematostella vectensis]|eukprot:XP_001630871.1 predicted protein [Nematostella vectensis]
MSTRKGNNSKRAQKFQNTSAFKNNLHDSTLKQKQINGFTISGVCARCQETIDWKRKYKKYKPLTAPKTCVKCKQKTIKHAYHTLCTPCAQAAGVCEKCGKNEEVVTK